MQAARVGRDKKSETGPNVPPDLECVTVLPLKTEAGNNEISRQKTIKNHKSSVLVSAIYNGWAEITRTMIDDRKKYNVNKGKCCGFLRVVSPANFRDLKFASLTTLHFLGQRGLPLNFNI